ncbi:hypothetical protein Bbelb_440330 [Branchiostoma belcheri]|nr:hypothetical protein Bbelb_440330 [Branchiostoma belcheri]
MIKEQGKWFSAQPKFTNTTLHRRLCRLKTLLGEKRGLVFNEEKIDPIGHADVTCAFAEDYKVPIEQCLIETFIAVQRPTRPDGGDIPTLGGPGAMYGSVDSGGQLSEIRGVCSPSGTRYLITQFPVRAGFYSRDRSVTWSFAPRSTALRLRGERLHEADRQKSHLDLVNIDSRTAPFNKGFVDGRLCKALARRHGELRWPRTQENLIAYRVSAGRQIYL